MAAQMLRAREWSIEIFSLATRKRRQQRCLSRLGQCRSYFCAHLHVHKGATNRFGDRVFVPIWLLSSAYDANGDAGEESRFAEAQIVGILKELDAGTTASELRRRRVSSM